MDTGIILSTALSIIITILSFCVIYLTYKISERTDKKIQESNEIMEKTNLQIKKSNKFLQETNSNINNLTFSLNDSLYEDRIMPIWFNQGSLILLKDFLKKEKIYFKLDSLKVKSKNEQIIVDFYHNFIKIKDINYSLLFPRHLGGDDNQDLYKNDIYNNGFKQGTKMKCIYFPAVISRDDSDNSKITKLDLKEQNKNQINEGNNFFNIFKEFNDVEKNQQNTGLKWKSNIPDRFIKLKYIGNENEEKIERFLESTGILGINQITILCLRNIDNKTQQINKVLEFIKQIETEIQKNDSIRKEKIQFISQNMSLIIYHILDINCLKAEINTLISSFNNFFEKFNQNIYYFCKENKFHNEYLRIIRHEKKMSPWLFK